MFGDEEYHTLCFIRSLLSHVVIKLHRFYFPWERESFSFIPQHALVRLPLLYHIALSQPPPHLSQSNQHLYKHHRPQVSEHRKNAVQCLNPSISHASAASLEGLRNSQQNKVLFVLTRPQWLTLHSHQAQLPSRLKPDWSFSPALPEHFSLPR